VVNPVATIESIRMMMDHLGETHASQDIEAALSLVLKEGKVKTRDMGGKHSTAKMGDAIKEAILQIQK
jgi:tartrate dehydrogenase/decarboxylase/D-malate dehydrogenase